MKNSKQKHTEKNKKSRKNVSKKGNKKDYLSSTNLLEAKIIKKLLTMIMNIKLFHWNTFSFASHKASDELYASLNEKMDAFVEVMLGKPENTNEKYKRSKLLQIKHLDVHNFTDKKSFKREIEKYKQFFTDLSNHSMFKKEKNSDLLNIRDEILADLNQFLYLLTLD